MLKKSLVMIGAPVAMVLASPSYAALDASVTSAIATTAADITEAGVLIIGLAVVALGVRWVKATFF